MIIKRVSSCAAYHSTLSGNVTVHADFGCPAFVPTVYVNRGDGMLSTLILFPPPSAYPDFGEAEHALQLVARFNSDGRYGFNRHSKVMRVRNNPWRMPPEAVVEQGLDAINAFLADVQMAKAAGGRIRSLQLLKVVLVGSSATGKTRYGCGEVQIQM